jgi:hypothetical protein
LDNEDTAFYSNKSTGMNDHQPAVQGQEDFNSGNTGLTPLLKKYIYVYVSLSGKRLS